MKNTIAYTSIEQVVVGDYKFNCEEYHFYDNEETAREEIEDLFKFLGDENQTFSVEKNKMKVSHDQFVKIIYYCAISRKFNFIKETCHVFWIKSVAINRSPMPCTLF